MTFCTGSPEFQRHRWISLILTLYKDSKAISSPTCHSGQCVIKINTFQRNQHPRMFCLILTQIAGLSAFRIPCPSLMLFSRALRTLFYHSVQVCQQRECHVPCCSHPENRRQSQLSAVCNFGQNPQTLGGGRVTRNASDLDGGLHP